MSSLRCRRLESASRASWNLPQSTRKRAWDCNAENTSPGSRRASTVDKPCWMLRTASSAPPE